MGTGPSVGLMLPTAADPDHGGVDAAQVLDAARLAEAAGFDGVYVGDHLVHPRPLLESVVTLSAVAATTTHVTIGFCVLLVVLRPPVVLAKQLATLAAFAPGRLRIGVGVGGEYPPEFAIVGVPLAERGRRTETAVRQLRSLLAGRPTSVIGTGGAEIEVTIAPAAPGAVPVLFAGWNDLALRRAARLGDGWIGYLLAPDSFERRRSLLLEHRADLGMPAPFTTGMLLPVSLDDARWRGGARRERWSGVIANDAALPDHLFVAGPPAAIVDHLHNYWERGCNEMVLSPVDQGAGFIGQVEVLAAEVLPRVRAFPSATVTGAGRDQARPVRHEAGGAVAATRSSPRGATRSPGSSTRRPTPGRTRVTRCVTLPDVDGGDAQHDAISLEWFADADHLERYHVWLEAGTDGKSRSHRRALDPDASPLLVADERVMRGADWLEQRWRAATTRSTHGRRRSEHAGSRRPSSRSSGRAAPARSGRPGATGDRDPRSSRAAWRTCRTTRARGRRASGPTTRLNEVYFDDLESLRRRIEWFREHLLDQEDDLVRENWFIVAREEVVLAP